MARSEAFARGERAAALVEGLGWIYDGTKWRAPPPSPAGSPVLMQRATRAERDAAQLRACGKNTLRFFEEHSDGGGWLTISGEMGTALLARMHEAETMLEEALGDIEFPEWSERVRKHLDRPKGEKVV